MITPKMVEFAMAHSHDKCENGCIHAEAFAEHADSIREYLSSETILCTAAGKDAIFHLFWLGVHVGHYIATMPQLSVIEEIKPRRNGRCNGKEPA